MSETKTGLTAEELRLKEHYEGHKHWLHWGPYLSERQWGTVREDYSADGSAWDYFPHDHARSRVYRWGEDGIAGISDKEQNICFSIALWNGKDAILKERMFGLTGTEGNHGEDVKELYYYLDNTPSHAYMKHLYKYPQAAYPYGDLLNTNKNRSKDEPEYELLDTGVFDNDKYFDVVTEYAKESERKLCIRITVHNRANATSRITLLPTLWCRNLWDFGLMETSPVIRPVKQDAQFGAVKLDHAQAGNYFLYFDKPARLLFTENETNKQHVFGVPNAHPYVKDLFHTAVINNDFTLTDARQEGSKFSPMYELDVPANGSVTVCLKLCNEDTVSATGPFGKPFDELFDLRKSEADAFYKKISETEDADLNNIQRQGFAGMLWSKQYYNIDVLRWLQGDPGQPTPPDERWRGRNHQWLTLRNSDIISMPDKWEYPWYAAWDLGFHCVSLSMVDPAFAKHQLILFLREWYMHPNGQLPAYEWSFDDVNPPVHAWAALMVYNNEKRSTGVGDTHFLKRIFQKLLLNFTWWVNRKDSTGKNIFEGGFLGLDNIGVFDRSYHVPEGGHLEQADATSWMGMYCLNMLEIALELSQQDTAYEDVATKFFEHFVYIAESINRIGLKWTGCWDEQDGFYYDVLNLPDGRFFRLKVRSLVGLTPMFAVLVIRKELLAKVPEFYKRLLWFQQYRKDTGQYLVVEEREKGGDILLSLMPIDKLQRILPVLMNESEFLAPGGIRSISKAHTVPFSVDIDGQRYGLDYQPGESNTGLFGGNSNWRGPVWMPMNYLIVLALQKFHIYHQEKFEMICPNGTDKKLNLEDAAKDIMTRLTSIFRQDKTGARPVNGAAKVYSLSPHFKDLVLFYEYFHGDNSRGVGASHQTGWTGVVTEIIRRNN